MAFFSVVIPTLNEEKFLPRLLQCLVQQTYRDFEILVVDGASTDKTVGTAKQFVHDFPHLHVIALTNRGVSLQKNTGARRATGRYLQFFDADITIGPSYLEELHEKLISQDCVFATTAVMTPSPRLIDRIIAHATNVSIQVSLLLHRQLAMGYCFIVKRVVFEASGGFSERMPVGEDHELSLRLQDRGHKMHYLENPVVTLSLRRFYTRGYLKTLWDIIRLSTYGYLRLPHAHVAQTYPMGGAVHQQKTKK